MQVFIKIFVLFVSFEMNWTGLDRITSRVLKSQVEEMETMEKEKEKYYELKETEMNEFRKNVENFVEEYRLQVEDLRNKINKVKLLHFISLYLRNLSCSYDFMNAECGKFEHHTIILWTILYMLHQKEAIDYACVRTLWFH